MSLTGKLVSQLEVVSSPDVLFDLFAHKPYQLVTGAPDLVKSVDLLDGLWGILGCVISSNYVEEGNVKVAKITIAAIDETNKSVTYLVIGGDLLSLYTTISVTFQVGTQNGRNIATWTFDYLKILPLTPEPTALMNVAIAAVKEVDAKNLK